MKWTARKLAGGQLATVMAQTMLTEKARDKFLARAGKPGARDEAVRQAFATVYGWRLPAELGRVRMPSIHLPSRRAATRRRSSAALKGLERRFAPDSSMPRSCKSPPV